MKKWMDVEKERQSTSGCAELEMEMQKKTETDGCNKARFSRRSRYRRGEE